MSRSARPVTALDVVASALARVSPRPVARAIDQARLDVHTLGTALFGERERSYATPSQPPRRAPTLAEVDPVFHALPRALRPKSWTPRYLPLRKPDASA